MAIFKNNKIFYLLLAVLGYSGLLFFYSVNSHNVSYADGIYCGWECSVAERCTDEDENGEPSNCGCQPQDGGEYYWQCNDPNVCSLDTTGCPGYGDPVYDSTGTFCGICQPDCDNNQCGGCGCGFSGGSGDDDDDDDNGNGGYEYQYQYQYQYQYPYPTPFNYTLSNTDPINVTKAHENTFTQKSVAKTLTAGTTEPVDIISVSGHPSGVSYSVANDPCNPTCSSTITFTVSPSAPAGTHSITVNASPLSKTLNFNLIINNPPITITCIPSSSTALIGQPVTWTGAINGGTSPYTYSWTGTNFPTSPPPSTNPYSHTYSTIGTKTAVLTVTDDEDVQGTCAQATVQVNFNPNFKEF